MDAIFAAANITGLAANISTLLIAFVGVSLLFLGYRHAIKALNADNADADHDGIDLGFEVHRFGYPANDHIADPVCNKCGQTMVVEAYDNLNGIASCPTCNTARRWYAKR